MENNEDEEIKNKQNYFYECYIPAPKGSDEIAKKTDVSNQFQNVKICAGTNVAHIPDEMFSGGQMNALTISKDFEKVGDGAFKNCTNLKTLTFSNGTNFGENVFDGCENIENINIVLQENEKLDYAKYEKLFRDCKLKEETQITIKNSDRNGEILAEEPISYEEYKKRAKKKAEITCS